MKTYSSYLTDIPRIINNSLTDNLTWGMETINDSIRYLVTKYYFNERSYTVPGGTVAQTQFYNLPPQVKKVINVTVTIGGVLWQPKECPSRQYWDYLNTITFYQDFPSFFFIMDGQVGIFPNPATSSNTITINYKTRIPELTMADVTQTTSSQTVSITTATTTVTASGATFKKWMADQWIYLPLSSTDASSGDGQWYQIDSVTSGTVLVLKNAYTGATTTGASFTIGQVPILPEDYQDLPLYRMGLIYYTTRFPDATKAGLYQGLWDNGLKALNEEYGSKTSSIILNETPGTLGNPALYNQGTLTQI
jgi:hypothetical protein